MYVQSYIKVKLTLLYYRTFIEIFYTETFRNSEIAPNEMER
jgi:hypothetical protein